MEQMRRSDRAQGEAWIQDVLARARWGVLATARDGQPFVHANLFAYDESGHALYLHTAGTGRTRSNVEENERVSFTAAQMGRLLPADTALEFSVEYASAVVFGRATVVSDETEATHGLKLLLAKYAPHLRCGEDYRPPTSEEIRRTTVFRVDIDAWSGKKKAASEGFRGAYHLSEPDFIHLEDPGTGLPLQSDQPS